MVRLARVDDLPALRELERAAGAPFRDVGMSAIADDEPPSLTILTIFQRDGRAWIVDDEAGRRAGYLLLDVIDDGAHIEQISVHPDHARRGLGRRLLAAAEAWAAERGLLALTLTTFARVPWNAPYYERLGFRVLTEAEMTEALRRIRHHEVARGLDAWPRVTMRRPLARSGR